MFRGYSEVQAVHEVLRCNRGYLERAIPIESIISELHAQDVLLEYEYHEVTSQPFPIKMNRSFLDALMKKSSDVFYKFCSILEGLSGYKYIATYLMKQIEDLDLGTSFNDKVNCVCACVCKHVCVCVVHKHVYRYVCVYVALLYFIICF